MPSEKPNEAAIFNSARRIAASCERAAFLANACQGDAALQARVERLLSAYAEESQFLEQPAPELGATLIHPAMGEDRGPSLQAGLAVAFGSEQAVVLGDGNHSVLKMLGQTLDNIPRVALRDSVKEGADPVVRPKSAEMPQKDSGSRYQLQGEIARGGMGAILKGRDTDLGRDLAIKVLLDQHKDKPEVIQRFVEEAQIGGQLQHPGIAPIYELGQFADKRPFFAMKLVKGETLSKLLSDREDASEDRGKLIGIFEQICQTMAYAHSRGVIHRDLKPANIMVGAFGEVQVMDWGLAKVLPAGGVADEKKSFQKQQGQSVIQTVRSTGSDSPGRFGTNGSQTEMGSVMGTPAYMPPEQALGEVDNLDERADVFGLGAILCEILTGKPPYVGSDGTQVYRMASRGKLGDCFQRLDDCGADAELIALTKHCLELEPQNRPRDAGLLAERVSGYLESVETKLRETERAKFDAQVRAEELRRRQKLAYSAGAAIAVSLLIGLTTSLWQMKRAESETLRATGAEQKAIRQADRAKLAEQRAVAEAERATNAEAVAKDAEAVAVREKETARQALAKSQLDLAEKEFERGKFVEAQKILKETPESFRDANWRFLHAHSRDFTAQLSIPRKGSAFHLQVLPPGDRFAVRCFGDVIGIFTLAGRQIGSWFPVRGFEGGFGIDSAGSRLALAASANEVAVYDIATGKQAHRWTREIGKIRNVLMSPDGRMVLVADGNKLIACVTETGAPLWTQPDHWVVPAFSPDGRTAAVLTAKDGTALKIQLLDTATGAARSTLEATADNPEKTTIQFNQAGDRLACLGGDELILWDLRTGAKIRALHFPGEKVKLLSPGGDVVATYSGGGIRLWDTTTGRLLRSLNGAGNGIHGLAFSPDSKMLLSSHLSSSDGIVHVWPTRLREEIASARPGPNESSRAFFNHDASLFYAGASRNAGTWDTRSGSQRWKFTTEAKTIVDLTIHPTDGSIIVSEFDKPTFTHVSSAEEALEAFGINWNSTLKFNRGGQFLLAVDYGRAQVDPGHAFSVMEYPSGKVLAKTTLTPHQPFAAFCLDDTAVATAALAGGITVWDWKAGKPLRKIDAAQTGSIGCLASSPDGRHLATGGPDRWIRVWEAATGRLATAFRAHWEGVRCVKFSPDGSEIFSGSEDGTVRVHDAASGEERLAFYGLNTPVVDVDISADATLITAITSDGFTKVWDRQLSSAAALLPKLPAAN